MDEVVLITGLSGAGRSQAGNTLEDLGWFVIDNMPVELLAKVAELGRVGESDTQIALVAGSGADLTSVAPAVEELRDLGMDVRTIFLDASTSVLVRRYSETRRRHPVFSEVGSVEAAIEAERDRLVGLRESAELVIDTSDLSVHDLRRRITSEFGQPHDSRTRVNLLSFGFKHGVPGDADIVFDCRFLPNPYWDSGLRDMTGLDSAVQDYVTDSPLADEFVERVEGMLGFLLGAFDETDKSVLTVAFGCTGGHHRSVTMVERLAAWLRELGREPHLRHRERRTMNAQADGLPSVVAIGGGHGLSATLRALRQLPVEPVAVVSVADDGGSTGRLRADTERIAPGDLRKSLVALAEAEGPLVEVMEHRFGSGELEGHSFGNLMLAAFEESTGSVMGALDQVSQLLQVRGRVLPASIEPVELVAELEDGTVIVGQEKISSTSGVVRVNLDPKQVACGEVPEVISDATAVILGPGSLYTSVLASAALPDIRDALVATRAPVAYVCNLGPQLHETDGYDVAAHVRALHRHGIEPDIVLYDSDRIGGANGISGAQAAQVAAEGARVHDPERLAKTLSAALGL